MTEARVNVIVGFHGEKLVAGIFAPTPGVQKVGEKALKSVMPREEIGMSGHNDIIKAPKAPWMAAVVDPYQTEQETIDLLGEFGSVTYVEDISRANVTELLGKNAAEQLLGRRPGVL